MFDGMHRIRTGLSARRVGDVVELIEWRTVDSLPVPTVIVALQDTELLRLFCATSRGWEELRSHDKALRAEAIARIFGGVANGQNSGPA